MSALGPPTDALIRVTVLSRPGRAPRSQVGRGARGEPATACAGPAIHSGVVREISDFHRGRGAERPIDSTMKERKTYKLVDPLGAEHQAEEAENRTPSGVRRRGPDTGPGVSARRLEANRRNARSSTGPRSTEGKARSSQNSLKHGLYQTDASAILRGPFAEDPEEILGFLGRIVDGLQPRDELETAIARNISRELLRGARLERSEARLFEAVSDLPLGHRQALEERLQGVRDLARHLEDSAFEKPGPWRSRAAEFIEENTDGSNHPFVRLTDPRQFLEGMIGSRWGDDRESALNWARARIAEIETALKTLPFWDEGAAAAAVVASLARIGALSTHSVRNLQRLLADYGRLQERPLAPGGEYPETNPLPPGGRTPRSGRRAQSVSELSR